MATRWVDRRCEVGSLRRISPVLLDDKRWHKCRRRLLLIVFNASLFQGLGVMTQEAYADDEVARPPIRNKTA